MKRWQLALDIVSRILVVSAAARGMQQFADSPCVHAHCLVLQHEIHDFVGHLLSGDAQNARQVDLVVLENGFLHSQGVLKHRLRHHLVALVALVVHGFLFELFQIEAVVKRAKSINGNEAVWHQVRQAFLDELRKYLVAHVHAVLGVEELFEELRLVLPDQDLANGDDHADVGLF